MFILFAPLATIYTYVQFEKASLRQELKEKIFAGIDTSELVLLKFSKEEIEKELKWENANEFEYENQMYDLVSTEIEDDKIIFTCWKDHEETDLNQKLKNLVAEAFGQDEENRETHEQLNNYFQSFFPPAHLHWQTTNNIGVEVLVINKLNTNNFTSLRLSPPTPPPQLS